MSKSKIIGKMISPGVILYMDEVEGYDSELSDQYEAILPEGFDPDDLSEDEDPEVKVFEKYLTEFEPEWGGYNAFSIEILVKTGK
jgi:hypothetical protein